MISRPSLAGAVALALAALSGCTSPETASDPMCTGFAAVGLTYATGDTQEGTVTVASLPLLSYYKFREDPKTHARSFRLCWLPLLGSLESETRDIRGLVATLPAPPSCPDDEPPPPAPKKGRIIIRTTDDEDEPAPPPRPRPAAPRPASSPSLAPSSVTPAPASSPVPDPLVPSREAPLSAPTSERDRTGSPTPPRPASSQAPERRRPTGTSNGAKILQSEPATRTGVDFFFPLVHVERVRPGTAVIQRPGRAKSIVEIGDSEDHVRALPIFSYRRDAERERLILWPLLASGFDDDAEGRHLVLFYFLRIRTGDPEKN